MKVQENKKINKSAPTKKTNNAPQIGFVHYWFFDLRGGEQVVKNFAKALPIQRIYALCGRVDRVDSLVGKIPVTWSLLNRLPAIEKLYRNMLPLFPFACATLRVKDCDIVISNESGPAKAVSIPSNALHICNCLTPMRYLWSHADEYLESCGIIKKLIFKLLLPFLRHWDRKSSNKVHAFISISNHVRERVKKYYGRDSEVIYPPVRYNSFGVSDSKDDYYLVLSALVSYKRIDLAVKAFNETGLRLKIAGDGPDLKMLKAIARPNIEFLGRVEDAELPSLYARAKAFIFPGEEDYGITPLEAQASGTPVIAFRKGGATETVVEYKTGIFFDVQETTALVNAINEFEKNGVGLTPVEIRQSVEGFSEEIYQKKIKEFVENVWKKFTSKTLSE